MQSISDLAGLFFVPVYFALIGYRLDLSKTFDPLMLAAFLLGTSWWCSSPWASAPSSPA